MPLQAPQAVSALYANPAKAFFAVLGCLVAAHCHGQLSPLFDKWHGEWAYTDIKDAFREFY